MGHGVARVPEIGRRSGTAARCSRSFGERRQTYVTRAASNVRRTSTDCGTCMQPKQTPGSNTRRRCRPERDGGEGMPFDAAFAAMSARLLHPSAESRRKAARQGRAPERLARIGARCSGEAREPDDRAVSGDSTYRCTLAD